MIRITKITNNQVTISWEINPDADHYEIYWSDRELEPEQYRQGDSVLRIKNWWWEEGCGGDMDMRESLADAWKRFGAYLGAERTEGTVQVIK